MLISQIKAKTRSVHAQIAKPKRPSDATAEEEFNPQKNSCNHNYSDGSNYGCGNNPGFTYPDNFMHSLFTVRRQTKTRSLETVDKSVFKHSSPI